MAGTVTTTSRELIPLGASDGRPVLEIITLDATADSADGSFPATAISGGKVYGILQRLVTNPGATAPTDNWDVTITDEDAFDVLGGAGANRDTTTTEEAEIKMTTFQRVVANTLSVAITGNSVNSATIRLQLYVLR